jgi:excisionase family DNA binding protein
VVPRSFSLIGEVAVTTTSGRLWTVREVAERLRVSAQVVYRLCRDGKLRHLRVGVGRGAIRVRDEDLNAFLEQAAVAPEQGEPRPARVKIKHLRL